MIETSTRAVLRLADLRRSKGYSQDELALLAGVSPSTIAHVEAGAKKFSPEVTIAITRALRLNWKTARLVPELSRKEDDR